MLLPDCLSARILVAAPKIGQYQQSNKGMMDMKLKFAAVGAFALILTACAQQEEPTPVYVQPSYDKAGTPSCPGGYQLATTEAGQTVCDPIQ